MTHKFTKNISHMIHPRDARISLFNIRILSVSVAYYPYPIRIRSEVENQYPYPIRIRLRMD